jgi:hypothetical protein
MSKPTYIDQDNTELYDNYDRFHGDSPVPQMLLDAEVVAQDKYNQIKVFIDYPIEGSIFCLGGDVGRSTVDAEAGKKAFVHKGRYNHPVKDWSSSISYWHPLTYIEECLLLFQRKGATVKTIEELIESRVVDYDLEEVFGPLEGELFYPVIDYIHEDQEGLHRAVYALIKDIDLIPVIIIK